MEAFVVSTSDSPSPSDVVSVARDRLRFLEADYAARVEVAEEGGQTVVAYVMSPHTFELELDWREGVAFMLVARTTDGKRPGGYYMHDGQRVRIHLGEVLENGTDEDQRLEAELRSVAKGRGPEAMKSQIDRYAKVLGQALRAKSPALLAAFYK
jgi:hypothetical protein